ncbi:conserved hypothetical protein [Histoplasma capsulatum H143]|uniref:Uncharacterized protein n=1 Tax=Ajellomyces capsulatus (strain H143) TaxID=544712 RepID=C6HST9_AJECH|nr:conserved hypothetical protein [Histoplasma capsulatum H143]
MGRVIGTDSGGDMIPSTLNINWKTAKTNKQKPTIENPMAFHHPPTEPVETNIINTLDQALRVGKQQRRRRTKEGTKPPLNRYTTAFPMVSSLSQLTSH